MQINQSAFQKIDTNKDGFIVPEELKAHMEKKFKELDRDGNGVLDAEELKEDKTRIFKNADHYADC